MRQGFQKVLQVKPPRDFFTSLGAFVFGGDPMNTGGVKRKLTAPLIADVKGYSSLMREDEDGTIRTLTAYRGAITKLIQTYRGRMVDTPGDNILADSNRNDNIIRLPRNFFR